jgi:hypothetical protein
VATLTGLILTLKQSEVQEQLKIVGVTYSYTLTFNAIECERNVSLEISADILGHDVVSDDVLAAGVDAHIVECSGTLPIEMRRSFLVGQSLLDEDVGTDEIKLRIRARDGTGDEIVATTGIVRGNF